MAKILITGGAGFIGSHTIMALQASGHTLLAFDDLSSGHEAQCLGVPLLRGDVRREAEIANALAQHSFDAVIHFAALIEAGRSVLEPDLFHDVNVCGTRTLLAAMRQAGVKKIIFSSTAAVYGVPQHPLMREDHPLEPVNPYGATKLACERMLAAAHAEWGLDYVVLRYFNAAGSDPDGKIGERHDPETHLIPLTIDAALGRRAMLQIYGNDYDTPDGTCIRDYVHVCDLANAHALALDYLDREGMALICNLGMGRGDSVLDIIGAVERVTGLTVPRQIAARRAGDPPRLVCAPDLAKAKLGWQPLYPQLEDMVAHCFAFRRRLA